MQRILREIAKMEEKEKERNMKKMRQDRRAAALKRQAGNAKDHVRTDSDDVQLPGDGGSKRNSSMNEAACTIVRNVTSSATKKTTRGNIEQLSKKHDTKRRKRTTASVGDTNERRREREEEEKKDDISRTEIRSTSSNRSSQKKRMRSTGAQGAHRRMKIRKKSSLSATKSSHCVPEAKRSTPEMKTGLAYKLLDSTWGTSRPIFPFKKRWKFDQSVLLRAEVSAVLHAANSMLGPPDTMPFAKLDNKHLVLTSKIHSPSPRLLSRASSAIGVPPVLDLPKAQAAATDAGKFSI